MLNRFTADYLDQLGIADFRPAPKVSGRLASYRIDQESGELTPLEVLEGGNRPMWVLITHLAD